MMLFSLFSDRQ